MSTSEENIRKYEATISKDTEWINYPSLDTAYGVIETTSGEWVVLKRVLIDMSIRTHTTEIARAPTRKVAFGYLKLLLEL